MDQALSPLEILLVEDDDCDAKELRRALSNSQIESRMRRCVDGVEALEYLRGTDSDQPGSYIILLDLNMPRMNGHEFLTEIRKDPKLCRAVIFVMSTSKHERDVNSAYRKNVAGYVVKNEAGNDNKRLLHILNEYWTQMVLPEMSSL